MTRSQSIPGAGRSPVWRTKNEAAYQILRARILNGDLTPGSEIDHETLASQLSVSSTPLREAIRRLQVEMLLETGQHQKVRVARLTARELREIYTVRLNLEPLAAELCARNATAEQIAHIQEIVSSRPVDGHDLQRMNRELHTAIFRASDNEVLIRLLDQLWDHADRYRQVLAAKPTEAESTRHEHQEHEDLVAALAAREPERAAAAMRHHLLESIDEVGHLIDRMSPNQTR